MSLITIKNSLQEAAVAYVSSIAHARKIQSSKETAVKMAVVLTSNQIWGRIFSFLPLNMKQSIALTCKVFSSALKEEEERHMGEVIDFINEEYLVLDANIDVSCLKNAIRRGITFLLADCHLKPSQRRIHEVFARLVFTPKSHVFTEADPCLFTKDVQLLARAEVWDNTRIVFEDKAFPASKFANTSTHFSLPSELIRVLKNTRLEHDEIALAFTLMFLHLVEEKNCSRFLQAMIFFYELFDLKFFQTQSVWPITLMRSYISEARLPSDFAQAKLKFLVAFYGVGKTIIANLNDSTMRATQHEERNNNLVNKISKSSSKPLAESCTIAQGGLAHFYSDLSGVLSFLTTGETHMQTPQLCSSICSQLKDKNIHYIVLYPKEPLIYQPKINDAIGSEGYKNQMAFYTAVDVLSLEIDQEIKESFQDSHFEFIRKSVLHFYTVEELYQKFRAFLTNEKEDIEKFSLLSSAAGIVIEHALDSYKKSL